jgi:hypothetical protein
MKLEFSWQMFEKSADIKFHETPYSESRGVLCGQTDGRTDGLDETNSRFSHVYEGAKKRDISANMRQIFDFPTVVKKNIYRIRKAINQPLTGMNKREIGRCVDWWL